jgi:hypothetical protein
LEDRLFGGFKGLSHGDLFDQRVTFGWRRDIMKKIVIFIFLCAVLAVPTTFAGNDQTGYALELDSALPDYVAAAWLGYLMERQIYIREHTDQYKLTPGIVIPTFGSRSSLPGSNCISKVTNLKHTETSG